MEEQKILDISYTIDYETYKKYYFFTLFKRRFKSTKAFITAVISFLSLTVVALAILICGAVYSSDPEYGWGSIRLVIIMYAVVILLGVVLCTVVPSSNYKRNKDIALSQQKLTVYENYIQVEQTGPLSAGTSNIAYEMFNNIYETGDAFYFILKNNTGYVVGKKYMDVQQAGALHGFLTYRAPAQFKQYI